MKNLSLLLISIFSLGIQNTNLACSCSGPQTFCATVSGQLDKVLIVRGKKTKQVEHGMDFEIMDILNGTESKKNIRVWGDPGHLCRLYTSNFEIGEEVILALHKIDYEPSHFFCCENEEKGDYIISVCGVYSIRVSDQSAMRDAEECLGEGLVKCDFPILHYYPNPTRNFVTINSPVDLKDHSGDLQILNLKGQVVFEYADIHSIYDNGAITMNLSALPKGIYFFRLNVPFLCPDPRIGKIVLE